MSDSIRLFYEEQTVHEQAVSRTGILHTPIGDFEVPGAMPSLRTLTDLQAVRLNMDAGLNLRMVSPYSSQVASFGRDFDEMFWPHQTRLITVPRPLVLADLESEALNFNCTARANYRRLDGAARSVEQGGAMDILMRTGATTDSRHDSIEAHSAWHRVEREFGFGPLMDWTVRRLAAVRSDVLFVPTPIVMRDPTTAEDALRIGEQMLPLARRAMQTQFRMHGLHFLIRAEVFDSSPRSVRSRIALRNGLISMGARGIIRGLFLSVKLDDQQKLLSDQDRGRIVRRNLSEFLTELQQCAQLSDSVLVAFGVGNRALGFLDSGTDIVSVRLTGRNGIDRIFKGRQGEVPDHVVPPITMPRTMVDEDPERVRRVYDEKGAFPVPSCLTPQPYWNFPQRDQWRYVARARCGVFLDLSAEYLEAAKDKSKPLSEAVASRVNDAGNRQELIDMCPSIREEGM